MRLTRPLTYLMLALHVVVFGFLAAEAWSLGSEISALQIRLSASEMAVREAALNDECSEAVWPNIPMHCLQRVH